MDVEIWAAIAAWVAAIVALASMGITLWVRWYDRKQASWGASLSGLSGSLKREIRDRRPGQPAEMGLTLFNVGDGVAQDVVVAIDGKEALLLDRTSRALGIFDFKPLVMPGDSVDVLMPFSVPSTPDEADWKIRVEWTCSPTRLGRRWAQTLHLRQKQFERLPPEALPKS